MGRTLASLRGARRQAPRARKAKFRVLIFARRPARAPLFRARPLSCPPLKLPHILEAATLRNGTVLPMNSSGADSSL